MPSTKRLRSVTHSIAHHSVSGLCYVHPHLGTICKEHSYREISVNLIAPEFNPELKNISRELELSTHALRELFCGVLESEKMNIAELTSAEALFFFYEGRWPSASVVRIIANENKEIECCVDSSGMRAEILQLHQTSV